MFTGLVDHCGEIIEKLVNTERAEFKIRCRFADLSEGESISINGACLTAVQPEPQYFRVQISTETLRVTNLGQYQVGDKVNLERAMLATDRLGGHWVAGHVDGVCTIKSIEPIGDFIQMTVTGVTKKAMSYLVYKGCIAVNGVSLTINKVLQDGFELMLIPHTLAVTNLHALQVGDQVNIEFDMLAKFVERQLAARLESVYE